MSNTQAKKTAKKRGKAFSRTLKARSLHFQALKRVTGVDW